jgi:hypothetical protein
MNSRKLCSQRFSPPHRKLPLSPSVVLDSLENNSVAEEKNKNGAVVCACVSFAQIKFDAGNEREFSSLPPDAVLSAGS